MKWSVRESEPAESEREKAFLRVQRLRGSEYAALWHQGLLQAIYSLPEPLGPRAWPQDLEESERRGQEVRYRLYSGPDRRRPSRLAYHLLFTLFDPAAGEEEGSVLILRVVSATAGESPHDPEE